MSGRQLLRRMQRPPGPAPGLLAREGGCLAVVHGEDRLALLPLPVSQRIISHPLQQDAAAEGRAGLLGQGANQTWGP